MAQSAIIFLILGATVYLLLFKRDFMIESNYRTPKIFLAAVCIFSVFALSLHLGVLDKAISG